MYHPAGPTSAHQRLDLKQRIDSLGAATIPARL
jgi:hypothetical protein